MTPIAERLEVALESEILRMQNRWFFEWHFIKGERPAVMDDFNGGTIQYSGIAFSGSARLVYWDSIRRYLRKKISELFDQVETTLPQYPRELRLAAITECHYVILRFAGRIKQISIDKDRILRGDGINFPPPDKTHDWDGADANTIQRRADGLRAIYCAAPTSQSWSKRLESYLQERKESLNWLGSGIMRLLAVVRFFWAS